MTAWTDRPLRTGPGQALAVEVSSSPALAHEIVTGALEGMLYIDCLADDLSEGEAATLRDAYLRGLAAAAIVVDAASGEREFTGAADFAANGREVTFLPTGATLGMLTQTFSALSQGPWVVAALATAWPETDMNAVAAHRKVLDGMQERVALAAKARMTKGRIGG